MSYAEYSSQDIYLSYYSLGDNAFRDKVRFYEENPEAISRLDFEEKVEIDIDYVLCLFELGRYQRFLEKVDPVIEMVIEENIFRLRDEDLFQLLLLKKSASLYHTGQFKKAETILLQLIKMDEKSEVAKKLYSLCKRRKENDITTGLRVIGMSGFLVVLSITVVRILLIEPFYDQYLAPFIIIRNFVLFISFLALAGIELYYQYHFYLDTGKFSINLLNKILKYFSPGKKVSP